MAKCSRGSRRGNISSKRYPRQDLARTPPESIHPAASAMKPPPPGLSAGRRRPTALASRPAERPAPAVPPFTAEKYLRTVLISVIVAPDATSASWKPTASSSEMCLFSGSSCIAEPPPLIRKKMKVSLRAVFKQVLMSPWRRRTTPCSAADGRRQSSESAGYAP